MKTWLLALALAVSGIASAQHNAGNNGKILMIASNPFVSKQTGWPIGVWYAELAHPYWEFSEAGYTVDIASPDGGEIKFDRCLAAAISAARLCPVWVMSGSCCNSSSISGGSQAGMALIGVSLAVG
jgi:putative intracellular protease/amidase